MTMDPNHVTWADAADIGHLLAFEECRIPHHQWDHRAHVRIAYLYLCKYGWPDALARLRSGIRALNDVHGVQDRLDRGYHETITHAFLLLVRGACAQSAPLRSSEEFCERYPELLDKGILLRFYSKERLFSRAAKQTYVAPDLAPLPVHESSEAT